MKQFLLAAFLTASVFHSVWAQSILPAIRRVDWSKAGYGGPTPVYNQVSITYFGAASNGTTSCNTALQAAITNLHGHPGSIVFPKGTYFFDQPITLPSNIVLKGEGRTNTHLIFDLNGANSDLISTAGTLQTTTTSITTTAVKGATSIDVSSTTGFSSGDYIRLGQNDAALIASAWALGSVGQLVQISAISSNTLTLTAPLRKNYRLSEAPQITRMQPVTGSGVECLSIKRLDATSGQTANIRIEYAAKCWVKNIESDSSNFAHVNVTTATNVEVTGSYFHGAFGYGGNGQGYGVVLQGTSGECLVENNAFRHLRHSLLLQSGANGNVLAYNYSTQPYWSDVSTQIPTDAAGDMVLHGNWPYANLFEGNYGQNIIIDNSHGANGPFNTFFRNRGANYGLLISSGAADSSNLIGNEITHATNGMYLLTGNGNFNYANNVKGTIVPAATNSLSEASLYRTNQPEYFNSTYSYPSFGPPNAAAANSTVPAAATDTIGDGCCCNAVLVLPITLQYFTAVAANCDALLQWIATDNAGDRYTIESSPNAKEFTAVEKVVAKGGQTQNSYKYTLQQNGATTWYRLKITNQDGSTVYSASKVVSSHCKEQSSLAVMPNPVGSTMHLQYTALQSEKAVVQVTDVAGKIVLKTTVQLQAGSNNMAVNVQALVPGMYHVGLTKTSGEALGLIQKIIKNNVVN